MRNIILAIFGLLLLGAVIIGGDFFLDKIQTPKAKYKKTIKTAFTKKIQNKEIPIILSASGNLIAKNKIDLFSEVQGVLMVSNKSFKPGTTYDRNEILLSINTDEFSANLMSQKSVFFNLITSVLPDIRLDYYQEFKKWNQYLEGFDINKAIPNLPNFSSDQEKYFISGRGIISAYYNIKNLEVRLNKHQIRAPFSGILTEVLVGQGALVRVGQKLGEYIDPQVYEMEVSINSEFADMLQVGKIVTLSNFEKTKNYSATIVRVNGKVDQVSQTIKVYIDVEHPDLKEGMFLEANLVAKSETESIEISRKLLVNNTAIYLIKNDSILRLTKVKPVYFGAEKVVIKGLPNNEKMLSEMIPGAFDGMIVKIKTNK